jgi:uncharacterized membrane protein YkoI
MKRRTKVVAVAALAAGVGIATAGAVTAKGGDTDTPITGDALTRASDAAIQHMGGGRVTGTEVGDEDSYYEVEVTLDDGSQVDVQLDASFKVVETMPDHEDPGGS